MWVENQQGWMTDYCSEQQAKASNSSSMWRPSLESDQGGSVNPEGWNGSGSAAVEPSAALNRRKRRRDLLDL